MNNPLTDQISLSVEEALMRLQQLCFSITEVEPQIQLNQSLGRVLARDIISPISVPPHDNSAMDGYAFPSTSLKLSSQAQITLRIVGKALAGQVWQGPALEAGQCVQITTGATMPNGCDTVVPIELVEAKDSRLIHFSADAVQAGENRRLAGEDLMQDSVAVCQGSIASPAILGLIASLGIAEVPVLRRLRVAYFSTGDEILSLGEPLRSGSVYDSNRYTVTAMLTRLDVEVIDLGVVPDNPHLLESRLHKACQLADVVITSGGVSVGEADHTKTLMRQLGQVEFWRIAMRPGRPMAVGKISKPDGSHSILFGLPGNPVAVMVTFLALVRPSLLKMMGANVKPPLLLRAKSLKPIAKKPGRTEYQRGIVLANDQGELTVTLTGHQGSGVLSSMAQANGLIMLAHNSSSVAAGDWVQVMMFDGVI